MSLLIGEGGEPIVPGKHERTAYWLARDAVDDSAVNGVPLSCGWSLCGDLLAATQCQKQADCYETAGWMFIRNRGRAGGLKGAIAKRRLVTAYHSVLQLSKRKLRTSSPPFQAGVEIWLYLGLAGTCK